MTRVTKGWPLVGVLTALVVAICWAGFLTKPVLLDGVSLVARLTVRCSLLLFGLAFTASAAWKLWPGEFTRWQLANRRYLGVAFAVAHFMHLAAIIMMIRLTPDFFGGESPWPVIIGGGTPYVLLALMVATSFDRTAAWLGPKWWRRLHATGGYALLIVFIVSFIASVPKHPIYWPFAAYAIAIIALRIAGRRQKRIQAAIVTS